MNANFKPGDIVQRSDLPKELAMLISENDFHPGYWKVLWKGEVNEWFAGNFKAVKEKQKINARHT